MLASEISTKNIVRSIFFWTFRIINALTSFLFGFEFVGTVFLGLFIIFPFAPSTAETLANLMAGFAALAVLDLAYMGWGYQQMNTAETMAQVRIAQGMGWLSFLVSCSYSAIVLALGMPQLGLSADQTTWIHLYGGFTFIAMTILHVLFANIYQQAGIAHKERATLVKMSANMATEQLDHIDKMNKQALLLMREDITADIPTYANMHRQLLGAKMRQVLQPKEEAQPSTPLLPSTTAVEQPQTQPEPTALTPEPPMTSTAANFRPSDNPPTPMVIFPTPSTNGYHSPTSNGSSRHEGF